MPDHTHTPGGHPGSEFPESGKVSETEFLGMIQEYYFSINRVRVVPSYRNQFGPKVYVRIQTLIKEI